MADFITKLARDAGQEKEPKDNGAAKARAGEVVRRRSGAIAQLNRSELAREGLKTSS
jgi:hypothetical protein